MRNLTMITVALGAAVSIAPLPALAFDGFETGNKLLQICESTNFYEVSDCIPYIMGAVNMGSLQVVGQPRRWCTPEGVTYGQMKDIVVKYLKDRPEVRNEPSAALIWQAMHQAFPCANSVH